MAIMVGIPSTVIRAAEPLSATTSPRIVAFRRRVGPCGRATDEAQFEFGNPAVERHELGRSPAGYNRAPWRMRTSLSGVKLAAMEHGLLGETGSTLVRTRIFQSNPNSIFHRRLTSSA